MLSKTFHCRIQNSKFVDHIFSIVMASKVDQQSCLGDVPVEPCHNHYDWPEALNMCKLDVKQRMGCGTACTTTWTDPCLMASDQQDVTD